MEILDPPVSFGRYLLKGRLATGGMAEIFKAELVGVEGFSKTFAIKRILPFWSQRQEFVTMLVDEAKVLVHLNHPNIVQVYELGQVGPHYFIAMEYIEGGDLRELTRQLAVRGQALPQDLAISIVLEALHGLQYAHTRTVAETGALQVIHRDISPQNILLSTSGEVKVTDFGIAKAVTQTHETQTGVLKGKYAYMAPEQAVGGVLDSRSDLFAMGIVLWELLFGERLFATGNDLQTLGKVKEAEIRFPKDKLAQLYPGLQKVLQQALAKPKSERFASAEEFSEALEACLPSGHRIRQAERAKFFQKFFSQTPNNLVTEQTSPLRQTMVSPVEEGRTTSLAISKSFPQIQGPPAKSRSTLLKTARFLPVFLILLWFALAAGATYLTWQEFFAQETKGQLSAWTPPRGVEVNSLQEPALQQEKIASLQLKVLPDQARLLAQWEGGEKASQGELQLKDLLPGTKVSVQASLKGYDSLTRNYFLQGDALQVQETLELKKQAAQYGSLVIQSVPWAYASVSGYIKERQTPVRQNKMKVGTYSVRLRSESLGRNLSGQAKIRANRQTVCTANWNQSRLSCR